MALPIQKPRMPMPKVMPKRRLRLMRAIMPSATPLAKARLELPMPFMNQKYLSFPQLDTNRMLRFQILLQICVLQPHPMRQSWLYLTRNLFGSH